MDSPVQVSGRRLAAEAVAVESLGSRMSDVKVPAPVQLTTEEPPLPPPPVPLLTVNFVSERFHVPAPEYRSMSMYTVPPWPPEVLEFVLKVSGFDMKELPMTISWLL